MRGILAAALACMCAGCVSTNAAVLDKSVSYQKICPDGVQIFTSAERVPGPYLEVALLNSSGESSWTSERGMAHSQQQKAAELGANGIIIGDTREPNAGTKIIGSILGTGAERKGKAVAIFIPSDSLRVQRVCRITPRALAMPYQEPVAQQPAPLGGRQSGAQPRPAEPQPVAASTQPANLITPPVKPAAPAAVPVPRPPAADPAPPTMDYAKLPPGTNYVGDARIRVYYPAGCAAQHAIPPDSQVFFQSADGAVRDGFVPSGDC